MSTSNNINDYCFPSFDANEIKEAFDCFDINKNGYISVNELKEIFSIIGEDVTNEELDEMIGIADKEGDGQVNWLNFYEFLTGNAMDKEIKQLVLGMNEVSQHDGNNNSNNSKSNVKLSVNIHEHMQSLKDDDDTIGMRDKHEKEVFDNIIHSINHTNRKNNNNDNGVVVKKEKDNEYELDASKDLLLDNTGANNNNNINTNNNNIRKLTLNANEKDESQNNILLLLKKKNLLNNN